MTEHEGTATEATAEEATAEESADQPAEANAEAAESPQSNRVSNREARYRLRLREAEAQRDALQERVTGMQRQAAESIAGETLRKAAAIWAVAGLPDLLAPDGSVDPELVKAAAARAIDELGAARPPGVDFGSGHKRHNNAPTSSDWSDAFSPH